MLRVAAVLAAALFATMACFSKPSDPLTRDGMMPRDGAGSGSGSGSGSGAPCTTAHDDFDSGSGCGDWAMNLGSGGMRINGQLVVTAGDNGCVSSQFKFANGASIEVPKVSEGAMMNNSFFRLSFAGGQFQYVEIQFQTGNGGSGAYANVFPMCSGTSTTSMPYSSTTHRWWKVVPSGATGSGGSATSFVDAQYSATGDAGTWVQAIHCQLFGSTTDVVASWGIHYAGSPGGGSAIFDNFNIKTCPP